MEFQNLGVSKELHGKIRKIADHQGKKIGSLCDQLFLPVVNALVADIDETTNKKEPNGRRSKK